MRRPSSQTKSNFFSSIIIIFLMTTIFSRADYVIRNLVSNMEISNACQVQVSEELTYVFTGTSGNYTQLSRSIPFTIANQISTQQISVEILEIKNQTNSLNLDMIGISSTTVQVGSSAYVIVSALTPKIQLSSQQSYLEIRLKRKFSVSGPVRKYDQAANTNIVKQSFEEYAKIEQLTCNFTFTNGFNGSSLTPGLTSGVVNVNVVTFTVSEVSSTSTFEPSVRFPSTTSYDSCVPTNDAFIIILVVVSVIIILIGVGCGLFASYYKKIPVIKRLANVFERNKDEESARIVQ